MIPHITFDPAAGPITAAISADHEQPGAYTLFLWKANENEVLFERKGNFINPADDTYELPSGSHHEQVVEALVTCVVLPDIQRHGAHLRLYQNGVEIGHLEDAKASPPGSVTSDLFGMLVEKAAEEGE